MNNQETLDNQPVKKMQQKEAVRNFILSEIAEKGVVRAEGDPLKVLVTKDIRDKVRARLFDGFKSGSINLNTEKDDSQLKKYCSGVLSNWLKKDEFYSK